jgi:NAD(P)-dependent dehydrogenase (short-subunit alcohol dehydrogenase family)
VQRLAHEKEGAIVGGITVRRITLHLVDLPLPLGRWGQREDAARMALSLACDDSSWITGQFFVVDGGFTAA